MSDSDIKTINKELTSNNYLSNGYRHLTRSKTLHFLFLLIEIFLNIFQELDSYLRDFCPASEEQLPNKLSFISIITVEINKLKEIIKLVIMVIFITLFDLVYIYLKRNNFLIRHTYIAIGFNILELFYFRVFILILFNLLFSLTQYYFLVGLILFMPHIFITIHNFLYNHLYYFVPEFIEYPYDEFTSLFDIILFFCKIILSIIGTSSNDGIGKFFFIVLFLMQIGFSFYFINKLINHSYLFMKNLFLNKARVCFFLTQSFIISLALLVGKTEVMSVLFIIVSIGFILIVMGFVFCLYNPFSYIKIKRETPLENIFFYLYILSNKNTLDFLFENKVNEHFEKCGICNLCKKYMYYFNLNAKDTEKENDEKNKLINKEKNELMNDLSNNNGNQLIDLFYIIYEGENKYYQLVKDMVVNYRLKGRESFNNNTHYFINLIFLMYSDYIENHINLSLNEKLILEVLNQENRLFLDNHQSQINQLLLCNKFINLSNKVINQLKEILNSQQNLNKAKKLIELSFMLKEMKNKKYKINLFCHKFENISNSQNLISACSIIYEEIFNTTLNNSQIPLRDNIQPLEDIFRNNSSRNDKIISLFVDLNNKKCNIIRAGRGLSAYINKNLFDLFPLIFQQYQINCFLSSVLTNFDNTLNKNKSKGVSNNSLISNKKGKKKNTKITSKAIKSLRPLNLNNKNKREYVEIKLIYCENISSKIYYKLLTLKLTPLFNNDNSYFILFDGLYYIHKYTFITMIDYEKNKHADEKMFAVSEPDLEKNAETYSMSLKKYSILQNNQGFVVSKVSSFNISFKLYSIYMVIPRDKDARKNIDKHLSLMKDDKILEDDDDPEHQNYNHKRTKIEKLNIMEDNGSVISQQTSSSHDKGLSSLGLRNKKKYNYYEYNTFNRLKKVIYLTIFLILIVIIFEYIHLNSLENATNKNNNSFLEYREFYKLYFQLFSMTLSVACIEEKCINLINYYSESDDFLVEESFDINSILYMQNQVLAHKIMEKRTVLNNIHKNIGNSKYNEIFGKSINYTRVSQTFNKNDIDYNTTRVQTKFSEAILIMCNAFKVLTEPDEQKAIIYFLNKTDNPFSFLNENKIIEELLSYQKEIYEMILNYKTYSNEFDLINDKLRIILYKKSDLIKICLYIYLNLDTIMILFIDVLIYLYFYFFKSIIIKIINFINMTMNTKNDDFNFDEVFTKKLDNLEIIISLYNGDPLTAIQNLNTIYTEYQQYLNAINKNEQMEMAKRGYRKNSDEENKKNEINNIPKNQRIVSKKDFKNLNIVNKYLIIFYIILLITIIIYAYFTILWVNYFETKSNLYKLMEKNYNLETSVYRAINIYNLMVFNNFTLEEVSQNIYPNLFNPNERVSIIKTFYENLKYAFNSKKEKDSLSANFYEDFEDISNFTCDKLYELNIKKIEELYNSTVENQPINITEQLISICNNSRITESNDPRTVFERHFQNIKNGLVHIDDFTLEGLIQHLKKGTLGKISLFFNIILIYLLELLHSRPHKYAIIRLLNLLKKYIEMTEITFIVIDIIFIIIIIFFFISRIKKYCDQILLLKNVFKIYEIQEQ